MRALVWLVFLLGFLTPLLGSPQPTGAAVTEVELVTADVTSVGGGASGEDVVLTLSAGPVGVVGSASGNPVALEAGFVAVVAALSGQQPPTAAQSPTAIPGTSWPTLVLLGAALILASAIALWRRRLYLVQN